MQQLPEYLVDIIMNRSNDGINVVDENGYLIFVNQVSADYAGYKVEDMVGRHITQFYPRAVLLSVLETGQPILEKTIHHVRNKRYVVNSYPYFEDGKIKGAFTIFRNIREIDELNRKIKYLELQLELNTVVDDVPSIIGHESSLREVIRRSRRTVGSLGGPRHSIISGESGTGKTMIASMIHRYALEIGVIRSDAPFVEINCAQFTNPDIAAVELFGSEEGAYTGSKHKKGLFEQADGGILFLDEAHALEQYQNLLLKVIETGRVRRIGGVKDHQVDVIVIAASTKDLKRELLPELYQRLAQYEMYLPSLDERSEKEKSELIDHFIGRYEQAVRNLHQLDYTVVMPDNVRQLLLRAHFPRNIRQLRDVINFSIDSAAPLIDDIDRSQPIVTTLSLSDLPFEMFDQEPSEPIRQIDETAETWIRRYCEEGLGPRRIAARLQEKGYRIKYYQVAYHLSKQREL